jgi:para-aminobenzoate synthetase/4-amino-4-deoxychorismate lyase
VKPRLILQPATERGWFGGRGLIASGAAEVRDGVTLAEAADALQAEFDGRAGNAGATAVLAAYDGRCTVVRFSDVERSTATSSSTPGPEVDPAAALLRDAGWDLCPRDFRAAVEETRERIAAGDVYVLNLTARLSGVLAVESPAHAFEVLCSRAGADMAALLEGLPGETPWLASVSPERFVRVRRESAAHDSRRIVEVCPIKGTRPRGATRDHDRANALDLASDEKERAEHIMVVDMERNDLGVCCVPGSVHVDPLCEVFATPYCHQMVSTVHGVLREEALFEQVLSAAFPCGSVTGAPKRAAMRIIEDLEASPRGAYCGALLVAVSGELDSSVLIRTLEGVHDEMSEAGEERATWGAGCGITYDSEAAAEALEVLLKASPVTGDGAPAVALRETMRVVERDVPLLDRHLARLASGGAGPTLLAQVRAETQAVLAREGGSQHPARLGVTILPDGGVTAGLTHEPSSLGVAEGPRLAPIAVSEPPLLPQGAAKPASRAYWDRAHRAARLAGADQAALHTESGTLIDGSTASIWLVRDGVMATPCSPPAVAGVCRELVFDSAREAGVPAAQVTLTLADLDAADEVWLSNAYGGLVAVRGRSGPVGEKVARARDYRRFAAE